MQPKKKNLRGKARKKVVKKIKPAKRLKAHVPVRRTEGKKPEAPIPLQQAVTIEPTVRETVRITSENIRGETAIGDLLVAFPWTRDVLVKNGLRLEAEDAGDIYMTIEAFSALNGLKAENLVQDLVVIARVPPIQQPVRTIAVAPVS